MTQKPQTTKKTKGHEFDRTGRQPFHSKNEEDLIYQASLKDKMKKN